MVPETRLWTCWVKPFYRRSCLWAWWSVWPGPWGSPSGREHGGWTPCQRVEQFPGSHWHLETGKQYKIACHITGTEGGGGARGVWADTQSANINMSNNCQRSFERPSRFNLVAVQDYCSQDECECTDREEPWRSLEAPISEKAHSWASGLMDRLHLRQGYSKKLTMDLLFDIEQKKTARQGRWMSKGSENRYGEEGATEHRGREGKWKRAFEFRQLWLVLSGAIVCVCVCPIAKQQFSFGTFNF